MSRLLQAHPTVSLYPASSPHFVQTNQTYRAQRPLNLTLHLLNESHPFDLHPEPQDGCSLNQCMICVSSSTNEEAPLARPLHNTTNDCHRPFPPELALFTFLPTPELDSGPRIAPRDRRQNTYHYHYRSGEARCQHGPVMGRLYTDSKTMAV